MNNIKKYKEDLNRLISLGQNLLFGFIGENADYYKDQISKFPEENKKRLSKVPFSINYESWYSESLRLIKQLLPERLEDFKRLYKDEKRKKIDFESYGVSDYLIGLALNDGWGHDEVSPKWCFKKFGSQFNILRSLERRFESSLFEIRTIVQADLFDSEVESAKELCKHGFYRAAGSLAGVVLEKHLKQVAENHTLTTKKKTPGINDYNQLLKDNNVIDVPMWRYIQRLGDIRNICDHAKEEEPTKEQVMDLIDGTDKVLKEIA